MHGGAQRGAHEYHIMVAVFDAATGARIADARISARVAPTWLGGSSKDLETMTIANAVTYGNYFYLPDSGDYTISVNIQRDTTPVTLDFSYRHP